jgi:hypothetical protein
MRPPRLDIRKVSLDEGLHLSVAAGQEATTIKIRRIGPWTPLIRTFSMSAVLLGPVMQVRALPGSLVPWVL